MSVIRVNKNKNYTVMSNYHLKDKNLSLKAKGLLSVMLSLPENWNYSIEGLSAINKESSKQIKTILEELKKYNYLIINKLMPNETKSGRIEYVYDIYETPKTRVPKQGGCFQEVENKRVVLGDNIIYKENTKKQNNINNNSYNNDNNNNIYNYIEENYNRTLSLLEIKKIDEWKLYFSEDIIKYAVEISILSAKQSFSYVEGILKNWKTKGYKTLKDIKQSEEEIKKSKEYKKNHIPSEVLEYDWLNHEQE